MKLGLITDIHEYVDELRVALDCLRREHVDQIVVLGDLVSVCERIDETCRLLADHKAIGVWGNHDFGLCVNVDEELRTKYSATVIDYMTSLKPRLNVADCHFTHVEPWLDPCQLEDLWYFEGPPDEHGKLDRIFRAVPNRLMFAGHYHQWLLVIPTGILPWKGEQSVCLASGRYFVVVGALCDGHFATFDTESSVLTPFRVTPEQRTEANR